MGRRIGTPALLLLSVLSGCAEHWARPGGTAQERQAALAGCDLESQMRFPPVLQTVMVSPGYFVPLQTRCWTVNNRPQCTTTGGYWSPPVFDTIDLNLGARRAARIDCMVAQGWVLAKDEKEAEAITRSQPVAPAAAPTPPPVRP